MAAMQPTLGKSWVRDAKLYSEIRVVPSAPVTFQSGILSMVNSHSSQKARDPAAKNHPYEVEYDFPSPFRQATHRYSYEIRF